jgi:hypothetical protein
MSTEPADQKTTFGFLLFDSLTSLLKVSKDVHSTRQAQSRLTVISDFCFRLIRIMSLRC